MDIRLTTMNANPYYKFIVEVLSYVVGGNKFLLLEDGTSLFLAKRSVGSIIKSLVGECLSVPAVSLSSSLSSSSCSSSSSSSSPILLASSSSRGSSSSLAAEKDGDFKFMHASRKDAVEVEKKTYVLISIDPQEPHVSVFDSSWSLLPNEQGRHGRLDSCMKKSILHLSPVHYTEKYQNIAKDTLTAHVYFSLTGVPVGCMAIIKKIDGSKTTFILTPMQIENLYKNAEPIEATFQKILQEYENYIKDLENEVSLLDKKMARISRSILTKEMVVQDKRINLQIYKELHEVFCKKINAINAICFDRRDVRNLKAKHILDALTNIVEKAEKEMMSRHKETSISELTVGIFAEQAGQETSIQNDIEQATKISRWMEEQQDNLKSDMDKLLSDLDAMIIKFWEPLIDSGSLARTESAIISTVYNEIERLRVLFEFEIDVKFCDLSNFDERLQEEVITMHKQIVDKLAVMVPLEALIIRLFYEANIEAIKIFYPVAAHSVTVELLNDLFGFCMYKDDGDPDCKDTRDEMARLKSIRNGNFCLINHETLSKIFEILYEFKSVSYLKFLRMLAKTLKIQKYNASFSLSCLAACAERGYFNLFATLLRHIGDPDNCIGFQYNGFCVSLLSFTMCLDDPVYLQCLLENGAKIDAPSLIAFSGWKEKPISMRIHCKPGKDVKAAESVESDKHHKERALAPLSRKLQCIKKPSKNLLENRDCQKRFQETRDGLSVVVKSTDFFYMYDMGKSCFEKVFSIICNEVGIKRIICACASPRIISLYHNTCIQDGSFSIMVSVWDPEICFRRVQYAVEKIGHYMYFSGVQITRTTKSENYSGEEYLAGVNVKNCAGEAGITRSELVRLSQKLSSSRNMMYLISIEPTVYVKISEEVLNSVAAINITRTIFVFKEMESVFDDKCHKLAVFFYKKAQEEGINRENQIICLFSAQALFSYIMDRTSKSTVCMIVSVCLLLAEKLAEHEKEISKEKRSLPLANTDRMDGAVSWVRTAQKLTEYLLTEDENALKKPLLIKCDETEKKLQEIQAKTPVQKKSTRNGLT